MRHPFGLELSDLENIQLDVETLTDKDATKITGGLVATTLALGEEGGCIFPPIKPPIKPPIYTTLALGEEGGDLF